MPYCVAVGCSNNSENGRLFKFPKNDELRLAWEKNLNRPDFFVTPKSSYLCQVHFNKDQFENYKQDSKIKLKPTAVPTIFLPEKGKSKVLKASASKKDGKVSCASEKIDLIKTEECQEHNSESIEKLNPLGDLENDDDIISNEVKKEEEIGNNDSDSHLDDDYKDQAIKLVNINEIKSRVKLEGDEDMDLPDDAIHGNASDNQSAVENTDILLEETLNESDSCSKHCYAKQLALKSQVLSLELQVKQLKNEVKKEKSKYWLYKKWFAQQSKKPKFSDKAYSDDAVRKAVQLRIACGKKGYNTLLSQGYQLPAIEPVMSENINS